MLGLGVDGGGRRLRWEGKAQGEWDVYCAVL